LKSGLGIEARRQNNQNGNFFLFLTFLSTRAYHPAKPLETRLVEFYESYLQAIFRYDWVRIFVFAGPKGVGISQRYLDLIQKKVVEPLAIELRRFAGLTVDAKVALSTAGARLPRRRRVVVELGPGDCAWSQPAHRAAGARFACGSRQGAVVRSRASASLDDPARAGIPDNLVTPRSTTE
jgi:hypothetical protein